MFHKFKAGSHYFGNRRLGRSFAINTQKGLRSGLAEKDPTIFFQKDFRAVELADLLNTAARKTRRRRRPPLFYNRPARFDRNVQIAPVIVKG